ncbi:MAG: hypothetical protein K2L07_13475 [Lachnospiraceae bacterium]|nr:hypothetical protein [Lachnospiraceae bacterium]
MGVVIFLVVVAIIWAVLSKSEIGRYIIFLGIVAILGYLGSLILPFLKYISYGAILFMLLLIGVAVYGALFGKE